MSKIFPIKNSSACALKWGWNTFRLYNGKSSSCHRVAPEFVPVEQFDQFHNMPKVLEDRALMRKGEWPVGRGCEYCSDVEQNGGLSDRLYHNQLPGQTPVNFGGLDHVTPSISEIYLDNTCDLACVYCIPDFSSKINQELNKFGPNIIGLKNITKVADSDQYLELYLNWLDKNSHSLTRISILGGEPLLQKKMWVLLDFLKTKQNPNLELAINTNLNASESTVQQYVETVKELILRKSIKRADIRGSLDCTGPQAEFIRYGVDLGRWQKNFEYLSHYKWLNLSIHQVIMSLSIKTIAEFQGQIQAWKKINPRITQGFFTVDGPNYEIYHPEIFGSSFFIDQLSTLANNFICMTDHDNICKDRLIGIINVLSNSKVNHTRLKKLLLTLNQIDQRRNTNWRLLWPEIEEFFIEQKIQNF